MSFSTSASDSQAKDKNSGSLQMPEIVLVDIGKPLAKIVREKNQKAVQEYWRSHSSSAGDLDNGCV
jgi:hypothetical protein